MKTLSRITVLIIVALSFVSASAQDFEGTWYSSSDYGIFGNIKIQKNDEDYSVQIKSEEGLKTAKGKIVNGVLCFECLCDVEYGRFWIDSWNYEKGCILVDDGNHGYYSRGKASNIYSGSDCSQGNPATVAKTYWKFKLVPKEDHMVLYWSLPVYYYDSRGIVAFSDSEDIWLNKTYTNW